MAREKGRIPEHGNMGESKHPTTMGVGHIGETPETEMNVGGGRETIELDEETSQISAGEPGLRTTTRREEILEGEEFLGC